MKTCMIIGLTLLFLSIMVFSYLGIVSKTNLEIVDSDVLHINTREQDKFYVLKNIGSISIVGGIAFVVVWFAKR